MVDQREIILARLAVVCAAVTGVASVARNRTDVDKLQRPAVVILDGSEERSLDQPPNTVRSEIQLMSLTPVIDLHVRGDGGPLLSLYRSRLLLAILTDTTLHDAVTRNGQIAYLGSTMAPPGAESAEYIMQITVSFTYVFRLADLAAA